MAAPSIPSQARSPGPHPATFLILAIWLGVLTGFGEVGYAGARKLALGRFTFLSPDIVWSTPTVNLVLFLFPGLGLTLAAWRGWAVSYRAAIGGLLFLSFAFLFLLYNPLHGAAAVLLAAGLAVRLSSWLASHRISFERVVHRSVAPLLLALAAVGLGLHTRRAWIERRAIQALAAAEAGAPNVLLIILDTVRALNLSLYGYERETSPELSRWAASGVRFERAFSTAPWTLPSHGSMFTGHWANELSADYFVPLGVSQPTLAEVLGARGYLTAGFVANKKYCSRETGLARGFAHYEDYPVSVGEMVRGSSIGRALAGNPFLRHLLGEYELLGRKRADDINVAFLRWIESAQSRPFFVFLNYYDAHAPYLPPAGLAARFNRGKLEKETQPFAGLVAWTPEKVQAEESAYDGTIAYLDSRVGALLDTLQRKGRLKNTIVIVTSDHGEEFGEHGVMRHGNSLYRPSVHVPLLIIYPGKVPAGERVATPVSLRDLPATILDLAGVPRHRLPGRSLARLWRTPAGRELADTIIAEVRSAERLNDSYPVSKGHMQSLVAGGWRYIRNGDGREELYDFERDPAERTDLAAMPDQRPVLTAFRATVAPIVNRATAWLRPTGEVAH